MQRSYYSFHFLLFSYQFFLTILQFRGCSTTLMLMAYITLLFHNSACFLKNMKCPFCRCSNSYILLSLPPHCSYKDLTKRDVKRSEISKLIPSKISQNLTAQMEGGYQQLHWCKQTVFKELNKHWRADVNRMNCLPIYHWGTLHCQNVIRDHSRTMKGMRCRQDICLHSLTLKQVQVGGGKGYSVFNKDIKSSPLNLSWVFSLNKPVKTKILKSHCALYPGVRAFLKHLQSFLRICSNHFRKDPHFTGFFFNCCMRPIQKVYPVTTRRAVGILTAEHQD